MSDQQRRQGPPSSNHHYYQHTQQQQQQQQQQYNRQQQRAAPPPPPPPPPPPSHSSSNNNTNRNNTTNSKTSTNTLEPEQILKLILSHFGSFIIFGIIVALELRLVSRALNYTTGFIVMLVALGFLTLSAFGSNLMTIVLEHSTFSLISRLYTLVDNSPSYTPHFDSKLTGIQSIFFSFCWILNYIRFWLFIVITPSVLIQILLWYYQYPKEIHFVALGACLGLLGLYYLLTWLPEACARWLDDDDDVSNHPRHRYAQGNNMYGQHNQYTQGQYYQQQRQKQQQQQQYQQQHARAQQHHHQQHQRAQQEAQSYQEELLRQRRQQQQYQQQQQQYQQSQQQQFQQQQPSQQQQYSQKSPHQQRQEELLKQKEMEILRQKREENLRQQEFNLRQQEEVQRRKEQLRKEQELELAREKYKQEQATATKSTAYAGKPVAGAKYSPFQ